MSVLRVLVLIASVIQIAVGGYGGYHLLQAPTPDLFGMILCSAVIIVGLASMAGLMTRIRPSFSRMATVKINLLILMLVCIGATIMYLFEHKQGATDDRLQFLTMAFAICASPFLVNSLALGLIEHRVRRLNEKYMRSMT